MELLSGTSVMKSREILRRGLACALSSGLLSVSIIFGQNPNDGFDPNANNRVDTVALQPDGKSLIAGIFSAVGGTNQTGLARLNVDGSVDTSFRPPQIFGGFAPVRAIAAQPDGKIIIAGFFKTPGPFTRTNIARLWPDGSADTSFVADTDNTVNSLLLLSGGRILVGGYFRNVNGQPHGGIVQLQNDGQVDAGFTITANQGIQAMLQQPDGKIVLSGQFTTFGGQVRKNLARLNADGTLDAAFDPGVILNPSANDGVHSLAMHPDGRILAAGYFANTNELGRRDLLRFFPDGTLDTSFPVVTNTAVRRVMVQPDGKLLIAGSFLTFLGAPRTDLVRLLPNDTVDGSFAPSISGVGSQPGAVVDLALQSDGKIIVCGGFTNLAGQARNNIGRLYPDGSPDATLNVAANPHVYGLALQPDNKIIVTGWYNPAGGRLNTLSRLNPEGSRDTNFNPNVVAGGVVGGGVWSVILQQDSLLIGGDFGAVAGQSVRSLARLFNDGRVDTNLPPVAGRVHCMALQQNGGIVLGGGFTLAGSNSHTNLARLNPDGSVDENFPSVPFFGSGVRAVAVHPEGKILLGGEFRSVGDQPRTNLARLLANGTVDETFNISANDSPRCFAFQTDGRILVGGGFTDLGGHAVGKIGRINIDGTLDTTFSPGPSPSFGVVYSMVLQTDGKILVGGIFNDFGGQPRTNLARLHPDGSLDESFNIAAPGVVDGLALQPDGKLLVSGDFSSIGGQPRASIARLALNEPTFQNLALGNNGTLTWTRTGVAPEVEDVTFELSTDEINYTSLGEGLRIPDGWEFTGFTLPVGNSWVRARGRTHGGYYTASSGLIESVRQFYRIPPPRIAITTDVGGTHSLTFTNPGHHNFTILATTNLVSPVTWESLGSPANIGGDVYEFTDADAPTHAARFYQLRSP